MMKRKYTEFFFGAIAFYIIDRFTRMLGTRTVNGYDKEFHRCCIELTIALIIGAILLFTHKLD